VSSGPELGRDQECGSGWVEIISSAQILAQVSVRVPAQFASSGLVSDLCPALKYNTGVVCLPALFLSLSLPRQI
jgi:hypothetical protein